MSTSQLSVQLYTVRDALAADLPGTLRRVADLGYTNVELFGFVDLADQYSELLPAAGLSAPSAHGSLLGANLDRIFAAATKIGVTTLIDPHIDRSLWSSREDVTASATQLNAIALKGADHGLTIGYHNHWWETENRIDGTPALEVFADLLDPAVILEVDTYWAEVGGVSAVELLVRLGDRVQLIHVKDGAVTQDDQEQVAVGSGRLNIPAILAAAPQALRVVELDGFAGDVFDALRDSFAYLTANGVSA
ncbi:sugar phosphate isomerase/epimerase [Lacisediminihabitans sp.]|uniref:sugar phosphate isomerase/epimerase family protein n=1 Tax=Lacisediminihabitans sp. TaxID=2787631 RepID=UPI002F92AE7B